MLQDMEHNQVSLEGVGVLQNILDDAYSHAQPIEGSQAAAPDPFPGLDDFEYATLQADIAALSARANALQGKQPTIPDTFGRPKFDPVSLRPTSRSKPFREVAAAYLTERTRDESDGLDDQTVSKNRTMYRLFSEWSNDISIDDVTPQLASKFLTEISVLNPRWG